MEECCGDFIKHATIVIRILFRAGGSWRDTGSIRPSFGQLQTKLDEEEEEGEIYMDWRIWNLDLINLINVKNAAN